MIEPVKTLVVTTTNTNTVVVDGTVYREVVTHGQPGPAGPPGPQGPVGPAGPQGPAGTDANYVYEQAVASDTWVIAHNLGKYPSVTIVDSAGDECEGNVNYIGLNQLIVSFSAPFSGRAFLN